MIGAQPPYQILIAQLIIGGQTGRVLHRDEQHRLGPLLTERLTHAVHGLKRGHITRDQIDRLLAHHRLQLREQQRQHHRGRDPSTDH
ncbi:Uncharacterised protein [Mycobacteroides abscessus subsp. abscessus]|nr:Uncharacterised protein [Mycobacteroides abscessus subsp. abscessus]